MKVAILITMLLLITARTQLTTTTEGLDCAISTVTTAEKVLAFTKSILLDVKKNATTEAYVEKALQFVLTEGMQVLYNLKQCGVIENVPQFDQETSVLCANEVINTFGGMGEDLMEIFSGNVNMLKMMMKVATYQKSMKDVQEKCQIAVSNVKYL